VTTTVAPRANNELVAVSWLGSAAGITPNQVATNLPTDVSTWADNGFVRVGPVVGGSPQLYSPLREPVLQIEAYAVNPNSGKPPWGKCNSLMQLLFDATYDRSAMQRTLTLPAGFPQAVVMTAHFVTEPRKKEDEQSSYACLMADLAVHWIEL
jgi:hypothetical protein